MATDIRDNTPDLTSDELNYVVQRFLSRIIFLRICEDRDIAKYETLRDLNGDGAFMALMDELRRADQFYDSGLFRLLDDDRLSVRIGDTAISTIIGELYYPKSPYTFAVVEPELLGEIYEQFLGDAIEIEGERVKLVNKPEVRESGGVIPTPRYIAYAIVERTLRPLLDGRSPTDLEHFTVADVCFGSGNFLLAAFEILLDHYLSWYLNHERTEHDGRRVYMEPANQWRLTFEERRRILVTHIRGVDIDPSAVEITQFSLLLKLIEGETFDALSEYVTRTQVPALPELDSTIRRGNSLISLPEWRAAIDEEPTDDQMSPFNWNGEFPHEMSHGGFDAIVGNPPYIRIQNMAKYSPAEVRYFRRPDSPYRTAEHDNFDKYLLFIERSITLVKESGRVGMIVPHKFATIQSGRALRRLISADRLLSEIVHFGAKQVFGADAANYTCILILDRSRAQEVRLERPERLESWRYGATGSVDVRPAHEFGEEPWRFADAETRALFGRLRGHFRQGLGTLAEIFVGVQTSADNIYIFRSVAEDVDTCTLHWNNRDWRIERGILRPCLHDVRICQFARARSNSWIIFPYYFVPNWRGKVTTHLIQPVDMANRFPVCWDYLNSRRLELETRSITGGIAGERQWYQYGRSQSLSKFDGDKIVLPILSTRPRYSYDDRNTFVTGGGNGPYYLIRPRPESGVSNHYLLAVLNHPVSEAFVRTETSVFQGGYYSHGKQFIKTLPIPYADSATRAEIEELVVTLIARHDALASARTFPARTALERETDDLKQRIRQKVSQVFRLSRDDLQIVNAVPIPD